MDLGDTLRFPPWTTMLVIDFSIIVLSVVAAILFARFLGRLREARAALGVLLLLLGLWVATIPYVIDLASMTVVPTLFGAEQGMSLMYRSALQYSWYADTVSAFLLFAGLGFVTVRLSQHISELRRESARAQLEANESERQRNRAEAANESLVKEAGERQAIADQVQEQNARLEQAVEIAELGYFIFDSIEDRCIYCSREHAAQHGLTPEEYIEQVSGLGGEMVLTYPDDRALARQAFEKARSGRTAKAEYRILTKSGGVRHIREVIRPILDENGRVIREIGASLDITEQIETEQRLRQAQKLEAIGQLTGGVAHDFNNVLVAILGNLEILAEDLSAEEDKKIAEAAIEATLRGRDLTSNLLRFARRAALTPTAIDLNELVERVKSLLERTFPRNISIELDLSPNLWSTSADRESAESAIMNLAVNARDAMPDGGELKVCTRNESLSAERLHELGIDVEPGDYVVLSVSDSGVGMPEDVLRQAFDPFFSTKDPGSGSGLGLAMVDGFMKQSGGAIGVESEIGSGTRFRLFFARQERSAAPEMPETEVKSLRKAHAGKILLVEDEPASRKVLLHHLSSVGYSVIDAEDGRTAIDLLSGGGGFDLVITDLSMPGKLQGDELAVEIASLCPGLPVIVLSGYPGDALGADAGGGAIKQWLTKPIPKAGLLEAVSEVLAMSATPGEAPDDEVEKGHDKAGGKNEKPDARVALKGAADGRHGEPADRPSYGKAP